MHAWLPGWRVVPVPASGQISNVSAFVLPERMPVADDERQVPMFPDADRLFRLLEDVAEAQRETALTQRLMAEHINGRDGRPPRGERRHQPQEKEYRTWNGFRSSLQRFERAARRDKAVRLEDEVTRKQVFEVGGPSAKTVQRILADTYGLPGDLWPPSTWPTTLPDEPNGQT
jgi:hypothetical protein